MNIYDPDTEPNAKEWLALDEHERISLIETYHLEKEEEYGGSLTMHASIHAIVEAQIAQEIKEVVDCYGRLMSEGLSRHDTLHAIGSILINYLMEMFQTGESNVGNIDKEYFERLGQLTKDSWLAQFQ